MAANVEPQEIEAILAAVGEEERPPKTVTSRDFKEPRRLSAAALERAHRALAAATPRAQIGLATALGESRPLRLGAVSEISAEGLLDDISSPPVVVEFAVDGHPGWMVWENTAAVACVDRLLGGGAADEPTDGSGQRGLSRVERSMVVQFADAVLRPLCAAMGLEVSDLRAPAEPAEISTWRDGANGGDNHRLALEMTLEYAAGQESSLRLYLPGIQPGAGGFEHADPEPRPLPALPEHLERVDLDLTVLLGEVELPLDDLLALEEGDVIPLSTRVGEPLDAVVEGLRFGSVHMGRHRGALAVRIHETRDEGLTPAGDPDPDPEASLS